MPNPSDSTHNSTPCGICSAVHAWSRCHFCDIDLCKVCAREHLLESSHTCRALPTNSPKFSRCPDHKDKDCEHYCESCGIPVCSTCAIYGNHKGHNMTDMMERFHAQTECLQKDLEELETRIFPQYANMAADVLTEKAQLESSYGKLVADVDKQEDAFHRKITAIANRRKLEIQKMKNKHQSTLDKNTYEISQKMTEVKQVIADLKIIEKSDDISLTSSYKSRNGEFRTLPPTVRVALPSFSPQKMKERRIDKIFGSLSSLFITTEHSNKMTRSESVLSPSVKRKNPSKETALSDLAKQVIEGESYPPAKKMERPTEAVSSDQVVRLKLTKVKDAKVSSEAVSSPPVKQVNMSSKAISFSSVRQVKMSSEAVSSPPVKQKTLEKNIHSLITQLKSEEVASFPIKPVKSAEIVSPPVKRVKLEVESFSPLPQVKSGESASLPVTQVFSEKAASSFPVKRVNSKEIDCSFRMEQLLDTPRLSGTIDTGYELLYSVSCVNEEQLWTCGRDDVIKLFNLQGEILSSVQTKLGNVIDIAVTRDGDLVYTDYINKTVNIVKNNQIHSVITLQGWEPGYVCCTAAGEFLITMRSEDYRQSKVARYTGSTETQSIQVDDQGRPLYSPGVFRYISENRNLDICVADWGARAVVVVNQAAKLRFRYTGHAIAGPNGRTRHKLFEPVGIATDSYGHILIADYRNNCIHFLDQDGQFLRYIQSLCRPWDLCVDMRDNLFIAERATAKVKKIHYLQTQC